MVTRFRRVLIPALCAVAIPVSSVSESTPPVTHNCGHLLTDPRGDAGLAIVPTHPDDPEADILFVDAVTTPKNIDFTVTMASVNAHPVTTTDVAILFLVGQRAAGYEISMSHSLDGDSFVLTSDASTLATPLTGSSDPAAGTYLVHVPRAAVAAASRGTVLYSLGARSGETVGTSAANLGLTADDTPDDYQYRVGFSYGCKKR